MSRPPPQTPPVEAVDPAKNGNGPVSPKRRKRWRGRRDWGGVVARVLCALFALVGLVPLVVGGMARLDPIQDWIARRTSNLLHQELGLDARYDLELQPWPLSVSMTNLEIAASDGGSPFLLARRVVARPRIFSLLAGKIDFGEVEIEEPQLRAVVRDGKIVNLHYKLPETKEDEEETEVPLSSISLTNARIDVSIDDVSLRSNEIDIDLVLDRGPLEVSARAGRTEIDQRHRDPIEGAPMRMDEDVVCTLTLRARYEENDILVRRLELEGAVDLDPAESTRPNCGLAENDWRRVTVAVASTQARLENGKLESLEGRVALRAPVPLVHRFIDIDPVTGWVDVQLDEVRFAEGDRLPTARGRVRADVLGIDAKAIAHDFEAEVATREDTVEATNIRVRWAGAQATIGSAVIRPFDEGIPLDARDILVKNAEMYDLLDDINVHPNAHVKWRLERTTVEHFGGTLSPVALSGPMKSATKDFAIYDRPATDPHKRRLMGVERGNLTGTFKVTPEGIVLSGYTVDTGKSRVHTTVGIMFNEDFELSVAEGSYVELADIAPVADIPMQGKATVTAKGRGTFDDPVFEGDVSIDAFEIGGFPIGNVAHGKAHFKPLKLELKDARLTHGLSTVDVPQLSLDFGDGDADLVMKGRGDTRATGLRMADFFEMVRLEKDPDWQGIAGLLRGNADVDFVLGGKRDRCGRGRLEVKTNMEMTAVQLFGESFQSGSLDMRYLWDDIDAGDRGIEVDVSSAVLRSANGTVLVRGTIRHGAALQAELTATGVALDKISAFQKAFGPTREDDPQQRVRPEADLSLVANLTGTLHRIQAEADIDISPMRIGPDVLPASRFHLSMTPSRPPDKPYTRCGDGTPELVAPAPQNDALEAVFALRGQLFGGQVRFDDVEITQQKSPMLTGTLQLRKLDLGALANLMPGVAFSAAPPRGSLDADVHIEELPVKEPGLAEVRVFVHDLELTQAGRQVHIGKVAEPLLLSGDALRIPRMPVEVRFPSGLKATVTAGGSISDLSQPAPRLALSMQLPPVDLSQLGVDIPQVERAAGTVRASIELEGTTENPKLEGWAKLEGGELRIEGFPVPLDEIEVDLRISPSEARIRKARARVGNTGFLSVSGRMPLRGLELAGGTATLVARDVKLPLADGVKATADATLHASYEPSDNEKTRSLPNITGTVSLTHFAYTRPMSFTLDLEQIYGRGKTEVDTYNPEDEVINFDVTVVAARPLRIVNNLVDMRLDVTPPGLQVAGTNERYGARGTLRVQRGSKVFLQGHDFSVDDGTVSFENMQRVSPKLDVHATTEYQRYASSTDIDTTATSSAPGDATTSGTTASTGGRWRIAMHAYGDIDSPQVRFSSDPPLSQDDIVLLLQVGMTRAELDRGLEGFAGVGLETLTTFGGVSEAVRKSLPLFDDAHVGSQYSSRSGRPEPTLTVGKRITDDVRATVSTGLSESREVRSTVEWKLKKGVSVQGRYDNVNDVSSSTVGNVGADLRWRLEFE